MKTIIIVFSGREIWHEGCWKERHLIFFSFYRLRAAVAYNAASIQLFWRNIFHFSQP